MARDTVYRTEDPGEPFRFNDEVAAVFPDMLRRSIPGYATSLEAIGSLAARYVRDGSNCYDLGCSLGAASLAMRQGIRAKGCRITAIDNAPAMIERCRSIVREECLRDPAASPVDVIEGDIREAGLTNASMVVLNYTLQFLPLAQRDAMIRRVFDGLNDGGLLVLSEKVVDPDPAMEALLVELHHEHKRRNEYSALEISRKRAALENVLIPETVDKHRDRLLRAGFSSAAVWLRYFNFVSIIAIR
ncbi:MAG: carboxy-S-adenosyl-L-methionine synthase CmoA [Gammaproteobacteria bacterium]|jgi:tRNA (cmo5U34)-methyltransferase|nr:carboxy-S-adenosyl-L-methionine synthase CmoA [Gammaproteobacteria bacterium]